jgi:hypothetical protein
MLPNPPTRIANRAGTLTHLAPEMFVRGTRLTTAGDVYAFGVLMWEFYTGKRPWAGGPVGWAEWHPPLYSRHGSILPLNLPASPFSHPHPHTHPQPNIKGLPHDTIMHRVLRRGLRPRFPPGAPPAYVALTAACWAADPEARPGMGAVIGALRGIEAELA